ncbi:Vinorine synthase-like [Quillaja saponaria]|uniref:Vinorine synthase-like n=1 Tax=Quillaja saponaria TaxID=32244 RepID=A0AAD7LRS0_QUISA|nr:Vinorine synthase-like [Quillaja saponaria]
MKLEVESISKELIKPSSPTPENLHHYQLSFLDQISAQVYSPVIYFFASNDTPQFNFTHISNRLKKSLSQILTHYYLLAGRVIDNKFIDCNDEGVPFLEARIRCKLNDVLDNLVANELDKLVPFELDGAAEYPFGVQLNVFDCGSVAIGACISHKIADGLSTLVFINSWATIAGGQADLVRTHFLSAKLFPPRNNTLGYDPNVYITKNKNIISKRFLFDASAIESLKARYTSDCFRESLESKKPISRVEALSTFIWSRFLASSHRDRSESYEPQDFYALLHNVNLRSRMEPSLPENSFGNYYREAVTLVPISSDGTNASEVMCYGMVRKVMDEIKKIDKDFINKLQNDEDEYLNLLEENLSKFLKGGIVSFEFTSLCRFPLYDADFGWGKPVFIGAPALRYKNQVLFADARSGDGIEAYISLKMEDMAKFENDKELLAFVSSTGSTL